MGTAWFLIDQLGFISLSCENLRFSYWECFSWLKVFNISLGIFPFLFVVWCTQKITQKISWYFRSVIRKLLKILENNFIGDFLKTLFTSRVQKIYAKWTSVFSISHLNMFLKYLARQHNLLFLEFQA